MKYAHLFLLAALSMLAACSSDRPVYSGKQESTEGVPGFVNGKKVSPHVKLGQSYTVGGETYVPRNQPDYVEEGMASWYGPGFHGGKTANGEKFDSGELTAAHRTLPLPSIVRVTMISTGKQAYVRINDRGPFAHSRIIDLSRAAAEKIGLLRAGVAKVRVEYMPEESKRFTELLGQGRDPKSIDLASEVLNYNASPAPRAYARGDVRADEVNVAANIPAPATGRPSAVPVTVEETALVPSDAVEMDEEEASTEKAVAQANDAAPVTNVASADLPVAQPDIPMVRKSSARRTESNSPFHLIDDAAAATPPPPPADAPEQAAMAPANGNPNLPARGGTYVQLGAFQNLANAERLRKQYEATAKLDIVSKPNAEGVTLYHVRVGPYESNEAGQQVLSKLQSAGAEAKLIHE